MSELHKIWGKQDEFSYSNTYFNELQTLAVELNYLMKYIVGMEQIGYLIIDGGSKDNTVEVSRKWDNKTMW